MVANKEKYMLISYDRIHVPLSIEDIEKYNETYLFITVHAKQSRLSTDYITKIN